ncbi:unnamed protein product [Closterium sp. NIES-64]|nr:unnamed protein product [Closterium sp. NIES-64]
MAWPARRGQTWREGASRFKLAHPSTAFHPSPLLQAIHLDLSGQFGQEERADVEGASVIGTAAFHRVASHRAIYIHHLLSFGFSVLYSDIDIAFLHNPLPFFQKPDSSGSSSGSSSGDIKPGPSLGASAAAAETITDFDMFLTHDRYMKQPSPYIDPIDPTFINGQPLFCSCFLFFRPTLPAKSLVGNWAFRMAKLGRQGGLDQDQLNLVMQWMLERKVLPRIGVLPPLQFPSGQLMKDHWGRFEEVRPRVVMVHANYLTGKVAKIKGLKKAGLWRVKVKEQGNATAAAGAAASRAPAAAAAGKGKGDSDKEAGVVEGNEEEEEKEDEEEEEEPVLLFPMPRRPDEAGEVDSLDETPGMLERGREEGRAGGKGKVGEARVGEPLAGGGGEGGGASGGSGGEGGGDWEAEVLGAVEPWVGEHLGEMEEKGMRIKGAAGMVIVTVACDGALLSFGQEGQEALFRNWFTHVGRITHLTILLPGCVIPQLVHPCGPHPSPYKPPVAPSPMSPRQEALFRNWFTHVGRIPSLGNIVLASVPPQMSMPGGHVITRSSDSVSPRVARATCLLLPPLILARLLAANVTVVYSDINSVWLRDPRRYFPPSHSLVLPSLSHQDPPLQQQQQQQQQPDTPPAQGAAENRQQAAAPAPPNTTALAPSLLGSLSPWLMALRPSPAVQAMVHRWAVGALRGYVTAGAAAARGGSGVFSGPEVLSTALNHAVAEMVRGESLVGVEEDGFAVGSEGAVDAGMEAGTEAGTEARTGAGTGGGTRGTGDTGASVGVLPEQLFPPGWRAVGDRAWLEAHRREIVAVQVSCREDGRQQEVCLRDMKLWL